MRCSIAFNDGQETENRISGVFYRVIARGNSSRAISGDAQDRERFLSKLSEYKERYDCAVKSLRIM